MNIINRFFVLKNDKTQKKSYTTTMFVFGNIIIHLKLLFAGVQIKEYKMSDFSGVDYAACMTALGAIYVGNKTLNKKDSTQMSEDKKDA